MKKELYSKSIVTENQWCFQLKVRNVCEHNILERNWKREVAEDDNKKNFKFLEESDLSKYHK